MENLEITRQELYDLVWNQPISSLVEKYALTEKGFRKMCEDNHVPLPKNGYWQKIKFGKQVVKDILPDVDRTTPIILPMRTGKNDIELDKSPWEVLTHKISNDPKAPLTVPETLIKPDQLTVNTKDLWRNRYNDNYKHSENLFSLPIYNQIRNRKRALLLMDTFVKLIRYRGHQIVKRNFETCIAIGDVEVPFSLREATKRVPSTQKYYTHDYVPTDVFVLKTGRYSGVREWKDGKLPLEKQLAKIMAKIEIEAEVERIEMEHARQWREQYEQKKQQEKEVKEKREKELQRFNGLLYDAECYYKAKMLREYILAVENKASAENSLSDRVKDWLMWSKEKANEYDPLTNGNVFSDFQIDVEEDPN